MNERRVTLAESLLQEAVYCARARQAAGAPLVSDIESGPGGCGLGQPVREHGLELTERGEELLTELFPDPLGPTHLARLRDIVQDWVASSDALDRKRNHFLRDFRSLHGFDRRAYATEVAREFEEGLERVNDEANQRLRVAAEELLRES